MLQTVSRKDIPLVDISELRNALQLLHTPTTISQWWTTTEKINKTNIQQFSFLVASPQNRYCSVEQNIFGHKNIIKMVTIQIVDKPLR